MKTNSTFVLKVMRIMSWVLFVGFCIQIGSVLISVLVSEFLNPGGAQILAMGMDLSALKNYSEAHYAGVVSLTVYFLAIKACMAYLVIQLFRKTDFEAPFSIGVAALITRISFVALSAGVVGLVANRYTKWLVKSGVVETLTWPGGEFLLLAGIVFLIAQIFQRGADLQAENALTV
ncbi:DUF2975 domain-containing protein [Hymenobacter taeanensis]|uniref:DUF2975 domain-containing protein n=1 Tax=Hymenobacter taeanensis TaxID=2735321 RepID=A0A6M6BCV3_9BACT|nr:MULTISPECIES: DUF2975 domain-containing protein [Hymenobacter]QJX46026.1 DUF2975 domain-containing protein [Hymenobacter taeanensis]UOQ79880.1 DUF2975 domain-containing protein [Hymenobacter sp. 5414T-23]